MQSLAKKLAKSLSTSSERPRFQDRLELISVTESCRRSGRRLPSRGFTLIELLVVCAIVAVLGALLIPAVQSARESSRRTQCVNNFKQIGLAMHHYHHVNQSFPSGRIWDSRMPGCGFNLFHCQDTSWFVLMLPEFEQQPLADSFNYAIGVGGPFAPPNDPTPLGFLANGTVTATKLDLLQCPSDRSMSFEVNPDFAKGALSGPRLSKGNYVANWGNTEWDQADLVLNGVTIPFRAAAFGQTSTTTIAKFTDGTAATALLSEVLQGDPYDIRGTLWLSVAGGSHYMSRLTPNSSSDIYGDSTQGDSINEVAFCVDLPTEGLPCVGGVGDRKSFAGVRSHHSGGVNVLYADGSVRFVKNSIAPQVWLAVNSISGGEVVTSESY